ncbi:MAG: exodeoxyribonuclease VII small subunit [Nevskia sp.]|nr:exodeoxyribonuclease VII small subunit [Nevskia sp.]
MSKKPDPPAKPAADPAAGGDPVSRFEASLKELEEIVARMERGDLPLEQSLQLFERGVALTRECRSSLDGAELRVRNLLEPDQGASFDATEDDI